ncbi:AbrB/MazE/SpoVT family DNA-binding domain-containing protein [Pseudanabaena sp. BC1403]|uniref:AbrB/MazE/SpoVT family DNA-binding domain-containing protein n=1 Tax=Pseudanabaena sp. BC1403 TaxID=2043171 RepID=UPI000CD895E0|nr:AbrB/MazE/SpoVT family DNA-binding domain-containing protein [Pseudanabaena sp. BC1403]
MQTAQKLLASKVTSKFQTTIPKIIRDAMSISQGDVVVFEIEEGRVFIKKLQPLDLDYLSAISETLSEWASPEDEETYCALQSLRA